MKNPELYHRSVDILVKAYVDGYLNPMDCAACAVGNLIAGNCGYKYLSPNKWMDANGKTIVPRWWSLNRRSDVEIMATGYPEADILRIEQSFMHPPGRSCVKMDLDSEYTDEDIFTRLMAVLSVLDQIHEVTDESIQQSSKAKFVQHETA